jgi:hypothetical protein
MTHRTDDALRNDGGPSAILWGKSSRGGGLLQFLVEAVTRAFPVISTDHMLIHEGKAYRFSGSQSVTGGGTFSIEFTTPDDVYIHFKPTEVSANGGPVTVTITEAASATGGSAATPRNKNRLFEDASGTTVKTAVTPSGGTVIDTLYIPSSTSGQQRIGGSSGAEEEDVLAQETTYILTFANAAQSATVCGWRMFWYEEDEA